MRVLFASADPETTKVVLGALERDEHVVLVVGTARESWSKLEHQSFDLVIVDARLPDGDSIEVCRVARANGVRSPIMLLTARRSVDRHVQGLDAGADASLAKPFAVAELRARVRALGRRRALTNQVLHVRGEVTLDFPRRIATVRGVEVSLTLKEWSILTALASARGRVVPRARLMEDVWGEESASSSASLEGFLTRIRKKLGHAAVRTLRTEGYALAPP